MTIRRGQVWDARLSPSEGSEQGGTRPVVVVSRDAINESSPVVVVVPLTDATNKRRLYPSHAIIRTSDGGVSIDSVALCEQVRALGRHRLATLRGMVGQSALRRVAKALLLTLDLRVSENNGPTDGGSGTR